MKEIKAYKTDDGAVFEIAEEAQEHEKYLNLCKFLSNYFEEGFNYSFDEMTDKITENNIDFKSFFNANF